MQFQAAQDSVLRGNSEVRVRTQTGSCPGASRASKARPPGQPAPSPQPSTFWSTFCPARTQNHARTPAMDRAALSKLRYPEIQRLAKVRGVFRGDRTWVVLVWAHGRGRGRGLRGPPVTDAWDQSEGKAGEDRQCVAEEVWRWACSCSCSCSVRLSWPRCAGFR